MGSRTLMIVVLSALLVAGLALSLVAAWRSGDWWGFALNLGTELVGAVVVYFLLDQFIERPREREQEHEVESQRREAERARLIAELGSSVKDVAVAAAEKLRQRGWLSDGSLQKANLSDANLREADLEVADLRETNLNAADLREAVLIAADLRNAWLGKVKLNGAKLGLANLNRSYLVVCQGSYSRSVCQTIITW